jgi:hypothetical protein
MAAGRWVLALDTRARHRKALSRHTGITVLPREGRRESAQRRRAMFLFARGRVGSSQRTLIVDVPNLASGSGRLLPAARRRASSRGARRASRLLESALQAEPANVIKQAAPQEDGGLPPEVQHVGWTVVQQDTVAPTPGSWTGDRQGIGVPTPGQQGSSWTINHDFDVYLDNASRPQGNFQVVTYNVSGQFNPADGGIFFHMNDPFQIGFTHDKVLEKAWWTGKVSPSVTPFPGTTQTHLIWQANAPATPNQETSYTSGNDFAIGFAGTEGPTASFTINNEQEHTVPDWGVQSETTPNQAIAWDFTARHPCDTREAVSGQNGCFAENFLQNGTPNQPNDLSLNQLQFGASARWRTTGVLSGDDAQFGFLVSSPVLLFDTYCQFWYVFACDPQRNSQTFLANGTGVEVGLDVSAVNPIPVQSLTLSPNPADGTAHQPVTGTVTLARAAPMDITVLISSNSQNAVVGPPINGGQGSSTSVVVPKDSTKATFIVQTNDNGLKHDSHTSAAISAFYTTPTVSQLQVNSG